MNKRSKTSTSGATPPTETEIPAHLRAWAGHRAFGPRGAYGGCWCMYWRVARSEFKEGQGAGNKPGASPHRRRRRGAGRAGLPRRRSGRLVLDCAAVRIRVAQSIAHAQPLDDQPVWSIVCFYVHPRHRGTGLMAELIEGAVAWARSQGAQVIEAYPTVPRAKTLPPVSSYMGLPVHFERAGFEERARPSPAKAVMRRRGTRSAEAATAALVEQLTCSSVGQINVPRRRTARRRPRAGRRLRRQAETGASVG